jgi:ubiquinone/menaquinone biosynthesis C-methylase UbiE
VLSLLVFDWKHMNTTTRKTAPFALDSNAAAFYSDYWTEGTEVSQRTIMLNNWIIQTFLPEVHGKQVLEVGVGGEGGVISNLSATNNVCGVDVSESAIRNCTKFGLNINLCDVNIDKLPFQDSSFDIVIALEVFEHFSNPQRALEEIRRVLRTGGSVLISIPTPWSYHWPRSFYPELIYNDNAFLRFLLANDFFVSQQIAGIVPCNSHRMVPEIYKTQNCFFMCRKLGEADAEMYFENAIYFWDQINEFGLRTDPVTAIDLFRKSHSFSNSDKSLLALTNALLYRVINCELDEFKEMFMQVQHRDSSIQPEQRQEWRNGFAKLLLEAHLLGIPLVDHLEMEKVWRYAQSCPQLVTFCSRLKIVL